MNGERARSTIGQLSRRTGLSVRTIRFYSDLGVVPPTDRTESGYRLYDDEAVARLDLVRTLRDLGIDLGTIQRVLDREVSIAELCLTHADALDAQIRTLRLQRAVLRTVARRGTSAEEMTFMNRLARLSAHERQRIIDDFYDAVFGGLDIDPGFAARMRSVRPDLPDDPTSEQVEAWVELAELLADEDYRTRIRGMAERQAADRARGAPTGPDEAARALAATVAERAGAAVEAGIAPGSAEARPIVDILMAEQAAAQGATDDAAFRRSFLDRSAAFSDRRAERQWELLGIINGWPPFPRQVPAWDWFLAALSASIG
jgi:DNA-binding transcriptional MerR regulator